MAKKVVVMVKLALKAGKATPAPPVGPALGQHGLNIPLFCKEYNARTADKGDLIIPVVISVYEDKTFSFVLKTPPASILLKQAANIKKGSSKPNSIKVGSIKREALEKIAKTKILELNTKDLQNAIKIIEGTSLNMGISIID